MKRVSLHHNSDQWVTGTSKNNLAMASDKAVIVTQSAEQSNLQKLRSLMAHRIEWYLDPQNTMVHQPPLLAAEDDSAAETSAEALEHKREKSGVTTRKTEGGVSGRPHRPPCMNSMAGCLFDVVIAQQPPAISSTDDHDKQAPIDSAYSGLTDRTAGPSTSLSLLLERVFYHGLSAAGAALLL